MQANSVPRDSANPAVNSLNHLWTSITLTVSSPNHFDLRINDIAVFRDMQAEFAVWTAAKVWRLRPHLLRDIAALSPTPGRPA